MNPYNLYLAINLQKLSIFYIFFQILLTNKNDHDILYGVNIYDLAKYALNKNNYFILYLINKNFKGIIDPFDLLNNNNFEIKTENALKFFENICELNLKYLLEKDGINNKEDIEKYSILDILNSENETLLITSIYKKKIDVAKYIINIITKNSSYVDNIKLYNNTNSEKYTEYTINVKTNNFSDVINQKNKYKKTALNYAFQINNEELCNLLIENRAITDNDILDSMIDNLIKSEYNFFDTKINLIIKIIEKTNKENKNILDIRNSNNMNLLSLAIFENKFDLIEKIINKINDIKDNEKIIEYLNQNDKSNFKAIDYIFIQKHDEFSMKEFIKLKNNWYYTHNELLKILTDKFLENFQIILYLLSKGSQISKN